MKYILLLLVLPGLVLNAQQRKNELKKESGALKLSIADYKNRAEAIWASQIISVLIGLQFEHHEKAVKWVDSLPHKLEYAPLDDDWYYEMITVKAFEKFGSKMTLQQLGEQWTADSCGIWGSSKIARWNMLKGIQPPASGDPFHNRFYNTIGPQFSADVYGILAPGMPALAGKLARYYSHINGAAEGVDGAVFVAGLISAGFAEKSTKAIVQKAAALLSNQSPYKQCLNEVMDMAGKQLPVQEIFDAIEDKWRIQYPANNNAVANGGIVAAALLFGEADFLKTLNLVCSAADYSDADCNAANACAVIAAMYGTKAIPANLLNGLHNRIKGNKIGSVNSVPPVDISITDLAAHTVKAGLAILKDNGIEPLKEFLQLPLMPVAAQAPELFTTNDMVNHWNKDWQIVHATRGTRIEQGALVTAPLVPATGMYLTRKLLIDKQDSLLLTVAADAHYSWELNVLADNDKLLTRTIELDSATGKWQNISIDISKYRGHEIVLRLYQTGQASYAGNSHWKEIKFQ